MSESADHVKLWLDYVEQSCQPTTLHAYRTLVRQLAVHVDHKPWREVSRADIDAFLARPRKNASGVPSERTAVRDRSIVKSFFLWLAGERLLPRDELPIYNLTKTKGRITPKREPVPDDIWLAVWDSGYPTMDDRLWLGLGYFCGLRRREMAQLPPFAVSPRSERRGSGSLRALRKGGGTQSGISYAQICKALTRPQGVPDLATKTDEWMDLLESTAKFRHDMPYLLADSGHDVERSMHTLWRRGRQLQDRVGIPREQQFSPHNLRHSAATNLALSGVPAHIIQKQLNHSSIEMTMHYINSAMLLERWLDRDEDDWAV
jgi:integrase